MSEKKQTNGKAWLKRETRPYNGFVLFLTFISVVVTLFSLGFAYLVRYLINSASAGNTNRLWIFSAVLLGVLLFKISLKTISGYLSDRLHAKMYSQMRVRTFSKILRSEYASTQGYHSGELLNRMTGDVQEICGDTVGLLPTVAGMIVQCLGAIVALLTIDPLFTLIYVVCGGIFGGLTALFRRQIKKRHKEVLEADGKARSFMQEGLSSVMTIKAYSAEGITADKASALSKTYYRKRMRRNVLRSEMNFIFSMLSNFGLIFAVVWCSISVLNGNDDYGSILSVILLLMQLQQPLTSFSSVLPVYYSRMASAERLAELDELPVETSAKGEEEINEIYGGLERIALENICFAYDRDTVLDNAGILLNKGEIVCLTGPSGAGKSTVFKLLLQVFKPLSGEVRLEGAFRNGNCMALTDRERGLFAYVPQGNFLFSGTIYENLTFFLGERANRVTEEEMKNALRIACADFVYTLPKGLQTVLAEGGEGLSEGQLQRLNVARAILSDRPILLLDEATSALDGETEKTLLENIRSLQDKTCLIVTHRPAALDIADRVLSVDGGKIRDIK